MKHTITTIMYGFENNKERVVVDFIRVNTVPLTFVETEQEEIWRVEIRGNDRRLIRFTNDTPSESLAKSFFEEFMQ